MISLASADVPLTIVLLGPPQILVAGCPIPRLRSRKTFLLLALLALRPGRPVEREWLAGTLWPDVGKEQGFGNLRPLLSDLRSALGLQSERLQSPSRHTVLLELAGADVDVLTFDAAVASQNLSALTQAVTRYRGSLLEGYEEEWVLQERHLRQQSCLQALQRLADHALEEGDCATAVDYYCRAVGLDSGCEAARRGWMEALARSGDTNAALQVYREFATSLKSDPRAIPDPRTHALYVRLRAEVRRSVAPARANMTSTVRAPVVSGSLPHPATTLIGRGAERIEVAAALRRSRLVTLTGPGGIGKTRLASDVAAEVVAEYADGVWLVGLETLSAGSLVVSHLASVLGVKEEKGRPLLQSVTEHLHARRLLLVLDNCEHLLEACAHVVAHLLQACAALHILATSREGLGITGELTWMVPALAIPDPDPPLQTPGASLRSLEECESVQLFVERAQRVQTTFALTETNVQAVALICTHLEGVPLAIELAASRVQGMTVEELAPRLQERLEPVSQDRHRANSRQQTLETTMDWSHTLLSGPERTLFRRLALFTGGWSLEAAEAICAGAEIKASQVLDLLASLVSKSLVLFAEPGSAMEGRYRFLEVVRQYAVEQLHASGETEQIRLCHRNWFLALAEQAEPWLKRTEREVWLRRLQADHANLRTVLSTIGPGEQGAEIALRLAGALGRFWNMLSEYSEGRASLTRALERKEAQRRTLARAKALFWSGALTSYQGDPAAARQLFEESLEIRRELGDGQGIADVLNTLGNAAYLQSDYPQARQWYRESLEIRRELGDSQGVADSLHCLAKAVRLQRDPDLARSLFTESLGIRRELGDRRGIADTLNNLGYMATDAGDYVRGQTLLEESLRIFEELNDRQGRAWALKGLSGAAFQQGDYPIARAQAEAAWKIFQDLDIGRGAAWSLHMLGDVAYQQGDYADAQAFHQAGLTFFHKIGDRHGVAATLDGLGDLLLVHSQSERAVHFWAVSERLRESLGLPSNSGVPERQAQQRARARALLGEEAFATAWEQGCLLAWEQAAAYALERRDL